MVPTNAGEFAQMIAEFLVSPIGKEVRTVIGQALRDKPEVQYPVTRQSVTGPVQTKVSLAQILGELTDQMVMSNQINHAALLEARENRKLNEEIRKLNARMLKMLKRQQQDDEDED